MAIKTEFSVGQKVWDITVSNKAGEVTDIRPLSECYSVEATWQLADGSDISRVYTPEGCKDRHDIVPTLRPYFYEFVEKE